MLVRWRAIEDWIISGHSWMVDFLCIASGGYVYEYSDEVMQSMIRSCRLDAVLRLNVVIRCCA
jgi:hypothetical protein